MWYGKYDNDDNDVITNASMNNSIDFLSCKWEKLPSLHKSIWCDHIQKWACKYNDNILKSKYEYPVIIPGNYYVITHGVIKPGDQEFLNGKWVTYNDKNIKDRKSIFSDKPYNRLDFPHKLAIRKYSKESRKGREFLKKLKEIKDYPEMQKGSPVFDIKDHKDYKDINHDEDSQLDSKDKIDALKSSSNSLEEFFKRYSNKYSIKETKNPLKHIYEVKTRITVEIPEGWNLKNDGSLIMGDMFYNHDQSEWQEVTSMVINNPDLFCKYFGCTVTKSNTEPIRYGFK